MKAQPDLFSELPPLSDGSKKNSAASSSLPSQSLKIDTARPTPTQQRFNKLLARVEALNRQIEATRAATDGHRPLHSSTLTRLRQKHLELMRRMAVWLDERLQRKGLTAAQKRYATGILISLSESLAAQGDQAMQALHDAYSEDGLDAKKNAEIKGMKELLEDALGRPLGDAQDPQDIEALLQAAMKEMQDQAQAREADRQARNSARKAKKPQGARQQQAQQETADAQGALRALFRQLASALHPDRETDPQEHKRKSALMSEVNAAYRRRDLTALLKLQLRVELADPQAIARMADQKVGALCLLLKDQVAALQQDLGAIEMQARAEFDLASHAPVNAASLAHNLAQQRQELEQDIAHMQQDLTRVRDDTQFKRWLREQHKASQMDSSMDGLEMLLHMAAGPGGFRRG